MTQSTPKLPHPEVRTSDGGINTPPDRLMDDVYSDLHHIARKLMATERVGHTLQATALVNEAWLRMNGRSPALCKDRQHVIAVATLQMRRALLDHARKTNAERRPNYRLRVTLEGEALAFADQAGTNPIDLIDLCVALENLEQQNERHCRVFELRFFGGQTVDECAEYLKVSARTVKYDWQFAAAWIANRLGLKPNQ